MSINDDPTTAEQRLRLLLSRLTDFPPEKRRSLVSESLEACYKAGDNSPSEDDIAYFAIARALSEYALMCKVLTGAIGRNS